MLDDANILLLAEFNQKTNTILMFFQLGLEV